MMFTETKLNDVIIIEPEKLEDERGFFARMWDKKIFESNGLNPKIDQCSISLKILSGLLNSSNCTKKQFLQT